MRLPAVHEAREDGLSDHSALTAALAWRTSQL